jgi:hypothetical protein
MLLLVPKENTIHTIYVSVKRAVQIIFQARKMKM